MVGRRIGTARIFGAMISLSLIRVLPSLPYNQG